MFILFTIPHHLLSCKEATLYALVQHFQPAKTRKKLDVPFLRRLIQVGSWNCSVWGA
jgi:hypothetical protein